MRKTCLLASLFFLCMQAHTTEIRYLAFAGYPNVNYFEDILRAAMKATVAKDGEYSLKPYIENVPSERIVHEAIRGEIINVSWGPAIQQLTDLELQTIPIPILNGLGGIRLMIINKGEQEKFAHIHDLNSLKSIKIGQHRGWIDANLIENNGVPVVRAERFAYLVSMLDNGRFDALTLGSNHILDSLADINGWEDEERFEIEDNLIVYYPLPFFFYVNQDEKDLAKRLERGLKLLKTNGQMDTIFNQHFGDLVERLNIKKRTAIILNNPYISEQYKSNLISAQKVPSP